MGKVYGQIDAGLRAFIEAQRVFFVATAPLDGAGHINLSPKGLDTLRVLGANEVAYLDHVGDRKGPDGLRQYQAEKNETSIDGLPAVTWVPRDGHEHAGS